MNLDKFFVVLTMNLDFTRAAIYFLTVTELSASTAIPFTGTLKISPSFTWDMPQKSNLVPSKEGLI